MHELGLRTTRTVVGHCDNVSAETLIYSPSLSEGARHVAVSLAFMRVTPTVPYNMKGGCADKGI